jgi:thiol-disulfide isomerase/thioredoxin
MIKMRVLEMKRLSGLIAGVLLMALIIGGCAPTSGQSAPAGQPAGQTSGPRLNSEAPDFVFTLGESRSMLSDLQGKPVMLNFWATWCGPCRQEIPFLQDIYSTWSPKGLQMLAVNLGEKQETVVNFTKSFRMTIPVVYDTNQQIGKLYRVSAIPTTYFIDKSGIIRAVKIGAFSGTEEIEKNLKLIMQ